jgi:two-component system, NtrC family, sensor kinase
MKLKHRISLAFVALIAVFFVTDLIGMRSILEKLLFQRLKTAEVLFAQDLANHAYRMVIEENTTELTNMLFDAMKLRREKTKYFLIFDKKNYLLAHTFLDTMPKNLLNLNNKFDPQAAYRIEKIKMQDDLVYDLAVPINEGLEQVGTLHLGIDSAYLHHDMSEASRFEGNIILVISFLGFLMTLYLADRISKPITKLKIAAERIGRGELETPINIQSNDDEIKDLSNSFKIMIKNIKKLVETEKKLSAEIASTQEAKRKAQELKQAYDELRNTQAMLIQTEKLSALGELSAGIAHELNSPLTGLLSLIRSYLRTKDPASLEYEDFKDMKEACEFMAKIIKDLNTFSKKSSGEFETLDCNEMIDGTLNFCGFHLEHRGIKIIKNYAPDLPLIRIDKTSIQQVIVNLVTNARDAMEDKKGTFTITTRNYIIDAKKYVEIEFTDTGCGIREENLKKIFTPFFTTKRPGKGVGLGLAISHRIIEDHKGIFLVQSKPGMGASFIARLPVIS